MYKPLFCDIRLKVHGSQRSVAFHAVRLWLSNVTVQATRTTGTRAIATNICAMLKKLRAGVRFMDVPSTSTT